MNELIDLLLKDTDYLLTTKKNKVKKVFLRALRFEIKRKGNKFYCNKWRIKGTFASLISYEKFILDFCKIYNYSYKIGNSGKKGGKDKEYIQLSPLATKRLMAIYELCDTSNL